MIHFVSVLIVDSLTHGRTEAKRLGQPGVHDKTRGDRKARFEQTAERHAGLTQFAGPFLSRMKFVDEQGEVHLTERWRRWRAYRDHPAARRRGLPPDAWLDFAPPALQPLIRRRGLQLNVLDRRPLAELVETPSPPDRPELSQTRG